MGKKVKVKVPEIIVNILLEDMKDFDIKCNKLCNKVFEYYSSKKFTLNDLKSQRGEDIQFTLTNDNEGIYYRVLAENKIETESQYMRALYFEYVSSPKYLREEIIFKDKFKKLREAIKGNKKIEIKFNGKFRKLNPYFIKYADRENRNYLFCYCEHSEEYRNYRVLKIESIRELSENKKYIETEYINRVNKNFDPFLSCNKFIRIRISEKGKEIMEKTPTNRPKFIREENGTVIYECSKKKAQIYFPQFFKEVEIIEPLELKEWFKNMYKESYQIYEN